MSHPRNGRVGYLETDLSNPSVEIPQSPARAAIDSKRLLVLKARLLRT